MKNLSVLLLLCFTCLPAWAQVSYRVLPLQNQEQLPINNYLYHYRSPQVIDILEAIEQQKQGHFKPIVSPTGRQSYGYNTDYHCLFFEVSSSLNVPQRLMLELEYSNIDEVELFEKKGDQIRSLGLTGDKYAFVQRPSSNNNYVYPLLINSTEKVSYFLLINQRNSILSFYVKLWQENAFIASDHQEYLVWGIFLGVVLLVLAFSFVMLINTNDRIYAWYALYLVCVLSHLLSDAGVGFQYLWPQYPIFNSLDSVYLLAWGGLVTQLTFMQYFIHQTRRHRFFKWVNAVKIIITGCLVVVLAIHILNVPNKDQYMYKVVSTLTNYFAVAMIVVAILSLRNQYASKDKMVKYYGMALFFQFVGYLLASSLNIFQSMGKTLPFDVETYVVIGSTTIIDIIFFSFGLSYRLGVLRRRNVVLQTDILNTRSLLIQQIIEILEEERRRIAQDLHDELGATLATAKGYLSTLTKQLDLRTEQPQLYEAQLLIDKASQDVRTISHNLMPKQFDKVGLSKSIEETIHKINLSEKLQFTFVGIGLVVKMPHLWEMQVFRMATELIQNTLKHSQATEATIQLAYHTEYVTLIAEDNGKGFNQNEFTGTGFQNLQARADYLKAEITVDSSEYGTTVIIDIPLEKQVD